MKVVLWQVWVHVNTDQQIIWYKHVNRQEARRQIKSVWLIQVSWTNVIDEQSWKSLLQWYYSGLPQKNCELYSSMTQFRKNKHRLAILQLKDLCHGAQYIYSKFWLDKQCSQRLSDLIESKMHIKNTVTLLYASWSWCKYNYNDNWV